MPQKTHALDSFLSDLFLHGEVVVTHTLEPFTIEEETEALHLLESINKEEQLNTPKTPIPFDPAAALCSAKFLYRAIQVTLLRSLDESTIKK